jgi:UPF0755 protein
LPRLDRSRPSPERTEEERERARLERERRRLERDAGDDAARAQAGAEQIVREESAAGEAGGDQRARREGQAPASGQVAVTPEVPIPAQTRVAARAPAARGFTRARAGALLALAAAVAAVWFLVSLFQPFAGAGSGRVLVEIPKGASSGRIGSILARDGVVPSGFFFELRAFIEGKRGKLHSGRFLLRRDMSYAAALQALSSPAPALIAVKLVIPEGFTRPQIARLAQRETLSGDYMAASRRSPALDPARYGAPSGVSSLEGFLFPATYVLSAGEPVEHLVEAQLNAFVLRFGPRTIARARSLGVTPYQLLTVASMIEREARIERDRPLIAAVIYNRLHKGMALGIDATIYYALALRDGAAAFERELTSSDLRIESPYNTRLHPGLPPTPIANPGVASIDAAAHPAPVPYLYYVAAPDGCGAHVFASSYERFLKDAAAYQAALKRNGGHLPACAHK